MATVYLARDLKHERPVAVKVLRPELAATLGPERFLREIRFTARLRHPHIVPLLDSGQAGRALYYVLPYIAEGSLRDRLRRDHRLPLDDALRLAREVGEALAVAHAEGIIHRDVKPENILLDAGHAVVSDFGVARAMAVGGGDGLTEVGLTLGTPSYMSPEQAAGDRALDGRTDVYSLGCVLYEMLVGEPPCTGSSPGAVLARALTTPAPSVSEIRADVPASVDAAIRRALARNRDERFQSADEFAAALGGSREPVATVTLARPKGRRRLIWSVGVLALGVAISSGVLVAGRGPRVDARRVIVAPFQNRTGVDSLANWGVLGAEWVSRGVALTDSFEVTTPTLAATERPSLEDARRARIGTLVSGSFAHDRDSIRFDAQVTDVRRGSLRETITASAPAHAPGAALDLLAQRVATALLRGLSPDAAAMLWGRARAPSYIAFQLYAEAHRVWQDDQVRAATLFERSNASDSTFVIPLVFAGFIYRNLGQLARAESLGLAAGRFRERLTALERASLDRMLADVQGVNRMRAYAASRRAFEADTGSSWARCLLAEDAYELGYVREAVRLVSGRTLRPGIYTGGGWCEPIPANAELDWHADPAAALREVARAHRSLAPPRDNLSMLAYMEVLSRAYLGQRDTVLALVDRLVSKFPAATVETDAAQLAAVHHPALARELIDRAVARSRTSGARESPNPMLANALYLGGRYEEVLPILEQHLRRDSNAVLALGRLGALAARRGDRGRATAMDARLAALDPRHRNGAPALWRARIAALLGESPTAVLVLVEALEQGAAITYDHVPDQGGVLGVHWDPDFASLRGYPPFDALLRPKD